MNCVRRRPRPKPAGEMRHRKICAIAVHQEHPLLLRRRLRALMQRFGLLLHQVIQASSRFFNLKK